MQPRRYTIIAGHTENKDAVALIHVDGHTVEEAWTQAHLMLHTNVQEGAWEVLYTFPGMLEPEEYFLEEAEVVQELNDRHRDTGRSTGEQSSSSEPGDGEVQPPG